MLERERVAGCPVFGGARVYGMMARADSWLVQPGAYAVRVGRTECPWQQLRLRRWKPLPEQLCIAGHGGT